MPEPAASVERHGMDDSWNALAERLRGLELVSPLTERERHEVVFVADLLARLWDMPLVDVAPAAVFSPLWEPL